MAVCAINLGHEVWMMGVGDLAYDPDDYMRARARSVSKAKYKTSETLLKDVLSPKAITRRITVDELDVLLLRNDPAGDAIQRPWAVSAGIQFGRLAMRRGVIVVNDPIGLAKAMSKMYFQLFPEEVRPGTLITRDREEIKAFAKDQGGTIVLKPLQGSGGQSVFLVRPEDVSNINQMIDAVSRDGYVIAQEYLPAAEIGDTRLFLMNGVPLEHRGRIAAVRRVRTGDDLRSNVHAGGRIRRAQVDDAMLELAEVVRPRLVEDGMFLVGLDIVGDRLMEINVFSPGGLGSIRRLEGVDFTDAVVDALERKVHYATAFRRRFDNRRLATL